MRMTGRGADEIVRQALASLAAIFGKRVNYRRLLEAVYWHDWQSDPFSSGAYSYAGVGGGQARKQLAKPVEQTLFFAGEATDQEEAAGVGGALNSGRRAAEELLAGRDD